MHSLGKRKENFTLSLFGKSTLLSSHYSSNLWKHLYIQTEPIPFYPDLQTIHLNAAFGLNTIFHSLIGIPKFSAQNQTLCHTIELDRGKSQLLHHYWVPVCLYWKCKTCIVLNLIRICYLLFYCYTRLSMSQQNAFSLFLLISKLNIGFFSWICVFFVVVSWIYKSYMKPKQNRDPKIEVLSHGASPSHPYLYTDLSQ